MTKFLVNMSGTVELDAQDSVEAEDLAIDLIHGNPEVWNTVSADIMFDVDEVTEL